MQNQVYFVKVLGVSGTVIAAPLDVANVQFTETAYVNGQPQPGSFELTLIPTWDAKYRRGMYNALLPEQRVEIYQNRDLLGDPVFTGVLRRRSNNLAGERIIKGDDVSRRLDARKLRAYQQLTGNAATVIAELLKTYNTVFSDYFTNLSAWSAGTWSASNNQAITSAVTDVLETTTVFTQANWNISKVSFDLSIPSAAGWNAYGKFDVMLGYDAAKNYVQFHLTPGPGDIAGGVYTLQIYEPSVGIIATRDSPFTANTFYHFDIYLTLNGSNYDTVVMMNGSELLTATTTGGNINHTGTLRFITGDSTVITNFKVANVIIASATPALAPGTIATTTTSIDQQFNGDSQLKAIQWICDYLGWTYRIRPKAGAGNDLFDCGATVGHNWTDDGLVFEEGKNLESLNIDESFDNIATQLQVYGQSRDDVTSGFISTNLAAMTTYGIVQQEYSDQLVISSDIAKVVGDARLTILSAGNVSLQGRIKDESYLYVQDPRWGYAIWGDAIAGGRNKIRVGDIVPIKSDDLNINRTATIVSLTKRSGDDGLDLVFDYHGWTASMLMQRQNNQIAQLTRALTQQIDSQNLLFTLSGTTPLTISFNVRGMLYKAVYVDVTSAAWAGAITLAIDTTDRTTALFGAATVAANAFAKDTTWLIFSGVHTITLTPTQTVGVTVGIRPILMG